MSLTLFFNFYDPKNKLVYMKTELDVL